MLGSFAAKHILLRHYSPAASRASSFLLSPSSTSIAALPQSATPTAASCSWRHIGAVATTRPTPAHAIATPVVARFASTSTPSPSPVAVASAVRAESDDGLVDSTTTSISKGADEWKKLQGEALAVGASVMVPGTRGQHNIKRTSDVVYRCDCIGWRQHKAEPAQRTCKHLKLFFGVAAEHARVGLPPPTLEELKSDEQKAREKEERRQQRQARADERKQKAANRAEAKASKAAAAAASEAKPKRTTRKAKVVAASSNTSHVAPISPPSPPTLAATTTTTTPTVTSTGNSDSLQHSSPTPTAPVEVTNTTTKSAAPKKRASRKKSAASISKGDVMTKTEMLADTKQPEPPMLLAEKYTDDVDPTGWWLSEKLDGVRAWWSGSTRMLITRNGQLLRPPAWYTEQLPNEVLDGELWMGRGKFSHTAGVLNRSESDEEWKMIKFVVFDAPTMTAPFEQRVERVRELVANNTYATAMEQTKCTGRAHLSGEIERVLAAKGEGIMLRAPGSLYYEGRSDTLLKAKKYYDDEGLVLEHETGKGRNLGRMGAIKVLLKSGREMRLGSGFTDLQRHSPPQVGSVVTFRYSDTTVTGLPRFAVFVRTRDDMTKLDFERQAHKLHVSFLTR